MITSSFGDRRQNGDLVLLYATLLFGITQEYGVDEAGGYAKGSQALLNPD